MLHFHMYFTICIEQVLLVVNIEKKSNDHTLDNNFLKKTEIELLSFSCAYISSQFSSMRNGFNK